MGGSWLSTWNWILIQFINVNRWDFRKVWKNMVIESYLIQEIDANFKAILAKVGGQLPPCPPSSNSPVCIHQSTHLQFFSPIRFITYFSWNFTEKRETSVNILLLKTDLHTWLCLFRPAVRKVFKINCWMTVYSKSKLDVIKTVNQTSLSKMCVLAVA